MRKELKIFRIRHNLTQGQLGNMFGITRQQYCLIETGRRKGSADFWLSLQKEFDLTNEETQELMENTRL